MVDGKSTDDSLEIVNNFKKSNLRIIVRIKILELVKSCNKATKQLGHLNFFVRGDLDDYISREFLKNILKTCKERLRFYSFKL